MIGMQVFISGHMPVMWSWMIPTPVLPSSHQASQNWGTLQSRRQQESHKSWKPVQVKALLVTLFPSLHHLQSMIACNYEGAWPNRSSHLNDVEPLWSGTTPCVSLYSWYHHSWLGLQDLPSTYCILEVTEAIRVWRWWRFGNEANPID